MKKENIKVMYDYLIVGAGLFGSVFAREATDHGKNVWCWKKEIILEEISIVRKLKGLEYINTDRTFSIRIRKKFGIM